MQTQNSKIKEQLKELYPYRTELHSHTTPVSGCGEATPEELVRIYKELGYHAIVITNHFLAKPEGFEDRGLSKEDYIKSHIEAYEQAVEASKEYGIRVLLGAEMRFFENMNDYLVYGADYSVLSTIYDYLDKGLEVFRREVKLRDTLLVQAHPFRKGMTKMNAELLDGIETFNMHPGHNSGVAFAIQYAKENKIGLTTAGSDFHHLNVKHEGVAALRTKIIPSDSFELARILKSGDYIFDLADAALVLP